MTPGSISVVIRVRNEGPALRKVLSAIDAQDFKAAEVIVVDNTSSDDSRFVAKEFGATILDIPRAEFTYGRALNMGIRESVGEFVCVLSAHSMPIGPDFFRRAIAPLANANVAAVRCLSVTNRAELEGWTKSNVLTWPIELETVIASAPVNCASMIRRSVWTQIPYDETLGAVEDKFWAFEVLRNGFQICNSSAVYLYLKDMSFGDRLRAQRLDRTQFFRKTGRQWQQPPVSFRHLLVNAFYTIPRRAIRQLIYEAALYATLKAIPYQVNHKHKTL